MTTANTYFCNYSIGEAPYSEVASVCSPFGKRILLLGGHKALTAGAERLRQALAGSELEIIGQEHYGKDCTFERIHELAELAQKLKADMIFGMGGGRALDTAKGAAWEAKLPVFTFPTIAATCAATTALSVVYREDGSFAGFYYFDRPARHCFIDVSIIAAAPAEYLRAGMGDTMGKYFECHFAARNDSLAHSSNLGRYISNMCYFPIAEHGVAALAAAKEHRYAAELEEAVLANIVSTGMVSLLVLDDYNGAVAHSVYYGMCLYPGFEEHNLHGDVVAYGVLVQLAVDKQLAKAKELKSLLQSMEIRTTLKEMGVSTKREDLETVLQDIVTEPDMQHIPYKITPDMIYEAMLQIENLEGEQVCQN